MKILKLMCLIIVLLGLIPASSVWSRGGHGGGHHGGHHYGGHHYGGFGLGLGLGYGLGYGGYGRYGGYGLGYRGYGGYYSPYYGGYGYGGGSPPVVYIQKEGGAQAATGSQSNYWHYCRKPEGYYPHVKKCPDGWMKVVPQPPAQ